MSQQSWAWDGLHLLAADWQHETWSDVLLLRGSLPDSLSNSVAVREEAVAERARFCLDPVQTSEGCYSAGFDFGHSSIVGTIEEMGAVEKQRQLASTAEENHHANLSVNATHSAKSG